MSEILLCTLNSTYQHSSFGLRYLLANMGDLKNRSKILEFTISQNAKDIAEKLLLHNPKIVGFGVYIWNTKESFEVVSILKSLQPDLIVILGGPEVSHETEIQAISALADYIIVGEADFLFAETCRRLLSQEEVSTKVIRGSLPDLNLVSLPYSFYSEEDLAHRVIYVEASRGCPYKCEYCLSSLDKSVRNFPIDRFLSELEVLIQRGARSFKFVDRTFNLSPSLSQKILGFFLEKVHLGLFLHFEMVPDRLPEELKTLIEKFPEHCLQFEIGIQTWNTLVAALVSRRQNYNLVRENLLYLKEKTKVHTHADLIVGLPGESLRSFAKGFDELFELSPDEIQVGLLKRLRGTPIIRHDKEFQMTYQNSPPYQILRNKDLSFLDLQLLAKFAKFWDLYGNSGHFINFINWLKSQPGDSFFFKFLDFTLFLKTRHAESFGISLINQFQSAWAYMELGDSQNTEEHKKLLTQDFIRDKVRDLPWFLKEKSVKTNRTQATPSSSLNLRQQRRQRESQP